ncbi:hypothetical protein HD554DRAFT_1241586 [Boletus coccyginus]|nr:hypothetical protein HD554DRAFT_1241586 [Boletus coccyginus]
MIVIFCLYGCATGDFHVVASQVVLGIHPCRIDPLNRRRADNCLLVQFMAIGDSAFDQLETLDILHPRTSGNCCQLPTCQGPVRQPSFCLRFVSFASVLISHRFETDEQDERNGSFSLCPCLEEGSP